VEHARKLQRVLRDNGDRLRHLAARAELVLETGPGPSRTADPQRWHAARRGAQRRLAEVADRQRGLMRWVQERLAVTRAKYHELDGWLSWMGIFRACPVPEYTMIYGTKAATSPRRPAHRSWRRSTGMRRRVGASSEGSRFA
jgi:hypothetical protein